jgi:hypothetical protein
MAMGKYMPATKELNLVILFLYRSNTIWKNIFATEVRNLALVINISI